MIEVIVLAIALSMDAFAVSIGLGFNRRSAVLRLSLTAGFYFGGFHIVMPLVGYWGGVALFSTFSTLSGPLAFLLLAAVGVKMIYEALQTEQIKKPPVISHKSLFVLAFATSIDALATGITLTLFSPPIWLSCIIIGLTTLAFSSLGVFIGNSGGKRLNQKAILLGGILLIAVGLKILLF